MTQTGSRARSLAVALAVAIATLVLFWIATPLGWKFGFS